MAILQLILFLSFCSWIPGSSEGYADESLLTFSEILEDPPRDQWERYVRTFRKDHHLSFHSFYTVSNWTVDGLAGSNNEHLLSRGHHEKATYTFHLALVKKFGYFLGVSMGVTGERFDDSRASVRDSILFPGLVAGFVYNFSAKHRLLLSLDLQLERVNRLRWVGSTGSEAITITLNRIEGHVSYEHFLSMRWALAASYVWGHANYTRPRGSEGLAINARVARQHRAYGLGLTLHFL